MGLRRCSFAVVASSFLLASVCLAQAPPAATQVTTSGATATSVSKAGAVTQVTTATVQGGNGYNAFSAFQVASGDTVNLVVPTAASNNNLINLVNGSATQIYGTLNALLAADGKIGGNLYFADPQGIIIGASGVVNAGSLSLSTPTSDFVTNFFNDVAGNSSKLIAGTEPIDSTGLISVLGAVHTAGPAGLTAGTVQVGGSVTTGAAQFGSLVNTTGLQTGQAINISGGTITIDGGTQAATLDAGTGDINLLASASDTDRLANAAASVTVGDANLSGNDIDIEATASATSSDTLGSQLNPFSDLTTFPWEVTGNAAWNTANSNANVQVGGSGGQAVLTAAGNVTLKAVSDASTSIGTVAPVGSFSLGTTGATATATVAGNAVIQAGGAFQENANITNTLSLNPSAIGPGTPSAAVSYGEANSLSDASLAGSVTAQTVAIGADNENTFSTAAGAAAADNGLVGIGVALGSYNSQAKATLSGSATATGADIANSDGSTTPALNLTAMSNNLADAVNSSSSVSDDSTLSTVTDTASGGIPFLGRLADYLSQIGSKAQPKEESNSSPLGLAGAVSYLESSNAATATLSGSGTATAGSAAVASTATDKPQSDAAGTSGGSKVGLGGGVAYANFGNTATTTVSGHLDGQQGVAVNADAELPNPFDLSAFTSIPGEFDNFQFVAPDSITDGAAYQKDWDATEALGGDIISLFNPGNSNGISQFLNDNLGLGNLVTSFVNTGASGDKVGVAGSVNILGITNQATATVASGAVLSSAKGDVNVDANANAYLINISGMAASIGQLKDLNPGAKGEAALGGSYNGVTLTNSAIAAIDDGAQATATLGSVNVDGEGNETLINVTQAGDNASKFGINGAFGWITANDTAKGTIGSNALVIAGQDVNVNAANHLQDYTIGGALGFGGNAEVGATVGWNQFTNDVEAYIGDPANTQTEPQGGGVGAGGNVKVQAQSNETLWNISLAAEAATGQTTTGTGKGEGSEGGGSSEVGKSGGSGKFGLGVSGNVAINDITDTTLAAIANAANVITPGSVKVDASDDSFAVSGGLAAALATTGKTGITLGGAFARNDFSKTTTAEVLNAKIQGRLLPDGTPGNVSGLEVKADNLGDLLTISAGGGVAVGQGVSLAGAVNNNVITNTTTAELGGGARVNADTLTVGAHAADRALAVAGALSYSGSFGLGAALDISNYTNTTTASIDQGAQINAGGNVQVTAATDEQLLPIMAALGVSNEVGLGGSASKDEIQNDTEATVDGTLSTSGNAVVGANDNSQLLLIVGSLGGGSEAGVGLAGAISIQDQPLLDRTVKATVGPDATVTALGNGTALNYGSEKVNGLLVSAQAGGGSDTIVAGVAGASTAAIAASLALNYFNEDVEAAVAGGATVNGDNTGAANGQAVRVEAGDTAQILDVVGQISGAGTANVGAAADVEFLDRTVLASLGGNIQADGLISANANLDSNLWSVGGSGGLGGTVAIDGVASAILGSSTTTAEVAPDAVLYTPGNVVVSANRSGSLTTIDGALGLAGEVSVGGAVSLVSFDATTTADVGKDAKVTALGQRGNADALVNNHGAAAPGLVKGLAVTANSSDDLMTIAAGGAVTLGVSVEGSVVLNNISETTQAYIDSGAQVNTGADNATTANALQSIDLLANSGTKLLSGSGALAAGIDLYGVGVGAAVNLAGPLDLVPSAFTGTLDTDLQHAANGDATTSPSGFTKLTSAGVNNGATVDARGALAISALSSENLTEYDASVAAGIVGINGTVQIEDYTPTTAAYFGSCTTTSNCSGGAQGTLGSAAIQASDKFADTSVVGGVSVGGVALGASVLLSTVEANTSAYVGAHSQLTTTGLTNVNSLFTDTFDNATLAGGAALGAVNVPYASITDKSNNAAFIAGNAQVTSGGLTVQATTNRNVAALSGAAVAGALGGDGFLQYINFEGTTRAEIGSGAQLDVAGLNLEADLTDTIPQDLPTSVLDISGLPTGVLGAAAAGVGASVGDVEVTKQATDEALVDAATVTSQHDIDVIARNTDDFYAAAGAAEAGVAVGGASLANITSEGATKVSNAGTLTSTAGSVDLDSELRETLQAEASGIGAGGLNGHGALTGVQDTATNRASQSGTITAANNATVQANTNRLVHSTAAANTYGALTVGISVANFDLGGSTSALLGGLVTGGTDGTGTITVQATQNDTDIANASVQQGGGLNGAGALVGTLGGSPIQVNPQVSATLQGGAVAKAPSLNMTATDNASVTGAVDAGASGAINVGYGKTGVLDNPTLQLTADGSFTGANASLFAEGNQFASGTTSATDSDSIVSGYFTYANTQLSPTQTLSVGGSLDASAASVIQSLAGNLAEAFADATAGELNFAAGGTTQTSATLDNSNKLQVGGSIRGGSASLTVSSNNNVDKDTATGGTGSGVILGAATTANTNVQDTTELDYTGSLNVSGDASLLAKAIADATSDAWMDTSGWTGMQLLESAATTTVNEAPTVSVGGSLQAGTLEVSATLPWLQTDVNTTANAENGLDANGVAFSTLNVNAAPTVEALNGSSLDAGVVNLLASIGDPNNVNNDISGHSNATAGTKSVTGAVVADTANNFTLSPLVNLESGSTITTGELDVSSLLPANIDYEQNPHVSGVSKIIYVAEQVKKVVSKVEDIPVIGWIVKKVTEWVTEWVPKLLGSSVHTQTGGVLNPASRIVLNSTINQVNGASGASLVIGADGQPEAGGNITIAGEDASSILLGDVVNQPLAINLNVPSGLLEGTPTINEQAMLPYVNITNDSSKNLIVGQLAPIALNADNSGINITAADDLMVPHLVTNTSPTAITITNNGAGDVLFNGAINDGPGSLAVSNQGGDILDTLSNLISVNGLTLDAPHGSIGTSAPSSYACALCPGAVNGNVAVGPMTVQPTVLVPGGDSPLVMPTVSATARNDISLDLTPSEGLADGVAAPEVELNQILAGGNVNLNLNPANVQGVQLVSIEILPGFDVTVPELVNGPAANTTYNVGAGDWLAGGGAVTIHGAANPQSQITLNNNGLVASGFQGINFQIDPSGGLHSAVTAAGQTNSSFLNYLQSLSGEPLLSNINTGAGGALSFTGAGQITGGGVLGSLAGPGAVSISNQDGSLDLTTQAVLTGPGGGGISFQGFAPAGPQQQVRYGQPNSEISLFSAGGLTAAGELYSPLGTISAAAQKDLVTVGAPVQGSQDVSLLSVQGNLTAGAVTSLTGNVNLRAGLSVLDLVGGVTGANVNLTAGQNVIFGNLTAQNSAGLTAGGDISQIGGALNAINAQLAADGNISLQNLTATGAATLDARRGNINLISGHVTGGSSAALHAGQDINLSPNGLVLTGGQAQLDAGRNIYLGTVQAGNGATLTAENGVIDPGTVIVAGGDANLQAANGISVSAVSAGGNAVLQTTAGDILAETVTAGHQAQLNAGGNIQAGAITAGVDATLAAGQSVNLTSLAAGRDAHISAGQDVVFQTLTAGGDAYLTAGRFLDLNSLQAGHDAVLTAGDAISSSTLTAGHDAELTAGQIIGLTSVSAANDATLQSGGDISVGGSGLIIAGHDASATAQGSFYMEGLLQAGHDATVAVGNSLVGAFGTLRAGHDAMLTAGHTLQLGTVLAGNDVAANAGKDILFDHTTAGHDAGLTAGGGIVLEDVLAGNNASLTAGSNIEAAPGSVTAGMDAVLKAGQNINLGEVTATAGSVTLTAGDSINAATGTVTAGTDAVLTAGQDVSLGTATAGNNASLTATAGDINLGAVTATAGDATLTAGHSINAATGTVTAGTDAVLTAGQDISLGTVTAANNATLTATAGDINLGAVTATAGNAALTAGHSINAAMGTVTAGSDAVLTAGQDISLGTVTAGNNATLTAGEDINLGAAGSITAGNTATLTAVTRDINLLGTVTAPTVTATANRNISGGGTVTANQMQLTAVTGSIGAAGDDLNLQLNTIAGATPQLTAAARYDNNLNISAISFDGIAPVKNDEPVGGDATLYADFNGLLAGGNLNLTLNPGLASGQPVNAWYEIPDNGIAVAGGAMNIQLTSPAHDADAVTLDVDGLLASGFDGIQYTVDPTGGWSTVLTVAGRSFQAPINFASIANGIIHLDNINTAEGGVISITGNGQLAEAEHIHASRGPAFVDILNQDAGLTLEANDITLGYGGGSFDLQRYSHHDGSGITLVREWGHNASSDDSHHGGQGWAWAWGWDNGNAYGHDRWAGAPQLNLQSASGISLMGTIADPWGGSHISAQGDISGSGLTMSKWLRLTSAGGAIGTPAQPLNIGITPGGLLNAGAAGDINLNAPAGDVPVGVITTPGDISLSAPAGSIGNGLDKEHGFEGDHDHDHDDAPVNNFNGANITLNAAGSIGDEHDPLQGVGSGVWNVNAGEGVALVSNGGFDADSLSAAAGAVHLWANGDASIASFSAPFAFLNVNDTGGTLTLGAAAIGSYLDADADNIAIANLTHADAVAPLHLSLQGQHDGMAQSIAATITSAAPVLVDEYASQTGSLRLSGDWLYLDHAIVGQSASLSNNWLQLDFNNVDRHQHPQMLHLDLVGDQFSSRAGQLDFSLLKLQPGASFTMPSDPSPTQRMMMKELHDRGRW